MKTLMTHLYYGDISPDFSQKLALTLASAGADFLEIGIPYSDPVCDGVIFQAACRQALKQGITPDDVINGLKKIRENTDTPIYLTSYFGPIFKMGIEIFLRKAKSSGVKGLIVPDLPLEEQKIKLPLIQFAAVNSSTERLHQIIEAAQDFIYVMSLPGITGDENPGYENLKKLLKLIKSKTDRKILVGFGIRTAKEAAEICGMGADGVIIGSRIAEIYRSEPKNEDQSLDKIRKLVINVKKAIG
ncbi:MAG: tryptophan synthase alpha chain, tryptophan synthase alpha chain [Candidatus Gottesmanbacteria bacterium GW2011_GWA2_43_14]|uniref:Tryptophan synthase alpha chain n=1 Tax=Candidatus Gottesmanbacteria bacterium GW2011_GWA2_43_14 TaxID=1618443 RepID=A0A0G1DK35_9BACT|nr:MAG: tryptophan synthase alpha chain, tryptophan synthase alpha chain [Candidatus Gottesmanbacteria bacterium GW2011_GWA2_43_14]